MILNSSGLASPECEVTKRIVHGQREARLLCFEAIPSPIAATWSRSCDVSALRYAAGSVTIELKDESSVRWTLIFNSVEGNPSHKQTAW